MTKIPKSKVDELRDKPSRNQDVEKEGPATGDAVAGSGKQESDRKTVSEEEALADEIRAVEEDAKLHYDKLLRVMAEFENFKKRVAREREELIKYGNEKLLSEMLPALDDLDRVLDHISPEAADDVKKFAEGVELVRRSLLSTLEKYGFKEVVAYDEVFDPSRHEAIATVESDAHEPGHVVAVHRKGYWLDERLLRPAMVTVAKELVPKGEES